LETNCSDVVVGGDGSENDGADFILLGEGERNVGPLAAGGNEGLGLEGSDGDEDGVALVGGVEHQFGPEVVHGLSDQPQFLDNLAVVAGDVESRLTSKLGDFGFNITNTGNSSPAVQQVSISENVINATDGTEVAKIYIVHIQSTKEGGGEAAADDHGAWVSSSIANNASLGPVEGSGGDGELAHEPIDVQDKGGRGAVSQNDVVSFEPGREIIRLDDGSVNNELL